MRDLVLREGPEGMAGYLPSGNAYPRKFLQSVFPLPDVRRSADRGSSESETLWVARPGPDLYLATLAVLQGRMKQVEEPQACYRMHGGNGYQSLKFEERLRFDLALFDYTSKAAAEHCDSLGICVNQDLWKANSWAHRVQRASRDIVSMVPLGGSFILVDDDRWKTDPLLSGRKRIPFLERDGQYWGSPRDDVSAIEELERLQEAGAQFIAFAWSTFWWFEYYVGLRQFLRTQFPCVLENDSILMFDLRKKGAPA